MPMAWLMIFFCISSGNTRTNTVTTMMPSKMPWSFRLLVQTQENRVRLYRALGMSGRSFMDLSAFSR